MVPPLMMKGWTSGRAISRSAMLVSRMKFAASAGRRISADTNHIEKPKLAGSPVNSFICLEFQHAGDQSTLGVKHERMKRSRGAIAVCRRIFTERKLEKRVQLHGFGSLSCVIEEHPALA